MFLRGIGEISQKVYAEAEQVLTFEWKIKKTCFFFSESEVMNGAQYDQECVLGM